MNPKLLARSSNDQGAAALEFAIVVPILLVLVFGMIEFGFIFQAKLAISNAAIEGARMASVDRFDEAAVVSRAYPLSSSQGLGVAMSGSGDEVRVVVTYPYKPILLPDIFGAVLPLSSSATMRKEY